MLLLHESSTVDDRDPELGRVDSFVSSANMFKFAADGEGAAQRTLVATLYTNVHTQTNKCRQGFPGFHDLRP